MKKQFPFLAEYADDFIQATGVDVLIKAETAARKLQNMDRNKRAEDRLFLNREELPVSRVSEGTDNRLDILHHARVLPGATCSAAKMWLHARSVMGNNGHPCVGTYDMAAIGLGGCVTPRGWVEIHSPSSPNLSIKMFAMGSAVGKARGGTDDEYPELEDLGEFKTALRVLRGAMSFVHPWNHSINALENFFLQNNFCNKDLNNLDKHASLLSRFTDYVLSENASRWRGMESFLDTRELRGVWADFLAQKSASFKHKGSSTGKFQKSSFSSSGSADSGFSGSGQSGFSGSRGRMQDGGLPSQRYNVPAFLFADDICVLWNMGKCLKAPGTCTNKKGVVLRHVCNWRPDMSKPNVPCEKNHMALQFHR